MEGWRKGKKPKNKPTSTNQINLHLQKLTDHDSLSVNVQLKDIVKIKLCNKSKPIIFQIL